ncbi:uncharacterized protein [Ptychodera flava]|uniref:uncharacterized protein n=1 Tax=Ptychodera flava TaxID=63121 RepID=UPI00396A043C
MEASADDLEAANIQIQTMKADAEEQTEKLSKEMDIISEQLKIKGEFRMKELDAKFQFISEQEINDEIRELKSGLERGFTSGVEKATRERISSLEASKITPREYLKLQSDIDSKIIKKKLQIEEERELFHAKEDKSEKESEVMKGISGMKIGRSGKHT